MTSRETLGARFSRKKRILLSLALLMMAFLVVRCVATRDEPPPNDADLRSHRRNVKDEENGFQLLDSTEAVAVWPEDDEDLGRLFGSARDFDRVKAAEIAKKNAPVFKELDRCLEMPEFQVPEREERIVAHPHAGAWGDIYHALQSRCRLRIEEGDAEGAYEDALRLIRLGTRLQGAQGLYTEYLMGVASESLGTERLITMAVRGQLPVPLLRRAIEELEPETHRTGFGDALRAEYAILSDEIDRFASGTLFFFAGESSYFRLFFKPNQTKRLLAEKFRALIGVEGMIVSERKTLEFPDSGPGSIEVFLMRKGGEKLLVWLLQMYPDILKHVDSARFGMTATRTMLGLLVHRAEKGALPDSLQALVPGTLDSVPIDPYSGKELRYSAAKQIIYSPGVDGLDSGGSTKAHVWEAFSDPEEPTLRLDPAAWKYDDE